MSEQHNSLASQSEATRLITSTTELNALCEELASAKVLAVDTEFVRDKTYFPKLCLVQVAANNIVACIDPLSVKDLSPLNNLLLDSGITKVFHAARQDMEILYYTFDSLPRPVFDTQIAATLLGLGEQIGYANLISHFLKKNLPKGHARADWEQRPLTAEQLEYAANDVRYLIQAYPLMVDKLSANGRLDWLTDDFTELSDEALYRPAQEELWQRISGLQKLRGVQLAVLQQLAAWREQTAMRLDKPRKWILPDDMLITIAMQMPSQTTQLHRIRGLNSKIIERNGNEIIKVIEAARSLPESQWPKAKTRRKLSKQQEALMDSLMSIVKLQAAQHEISTGAITSKSELEKLVNGDHDIMLLHGWRVDVAGQQVLDFLDGKTRLQYKNNRLELE
jgi:ribonuclease D